MTDENPTYTFSTTTTQARTYEDGFSEGYSRAWIECWDYMIQEAQKLKKEESSKEKSDE